MKKIVALVLSLVMALSLCTVAFAAVKNGDTLYDEDGAKYEYVAEKANKDGSGWINHYEVYDAEDEVYYTFVECSKNDKDAIALYEKEEHYVGDPVVVYVKDDVALYDVTATAVKAEKWDCTTDKHAEGYKDTNDNYWVDYDWKAETLAELKIAKVGDKLVEVETDGSYLAASHLLYQYKSKEVSTGVYVYKCAICGKEFNATAFEAYAGKKYVKYNPPAEVIDLLFAEDRNDVKTQYKKVLDQLGLKAKTDFDTGTLYLIGEAKADTTKTDGISSPKTFDAGIAMYVGMSLLSVAGGAVVIGKKKEF